MSKLDSINLEKLYQGDRRTVAKALTLVESKHPEHRRDSQSLLQTIYPKTGKSVRIGISGVPGVGKSTFIESFGLELIQQGHKVAVLAVDPSSPVQGGSILGDKTRMEKLSVNDSAFIRPSPSDGTLGGVANTTRENILVCEAAGYDVILVETVGVGQSEYEVAAMVDFFLVLMLPNAGDELQGIKRGIMELADALIINKSDGDFLKAAQQSQRYYKNALHLLHQQRSADEHSWEPKVLCCSALNHAGISDIWTMIGDYQQTAQSSGNFQAKRIHQQKEWLVKLAERQLIEAFQSSVDCQQRLSSQQDRLSSGETNPHQAAQEIIESFLK